MGVELGKDEDLVSFKAVSGGLLKTLPVCCHIWQARINCFEKRLPPGHCNEED